MCVCQGEHEYGWDGAWELFRERLPDEIDHEWRAYPHVVGYFHTLICVRVCVFDRNLRAWFFVVRLLQDLAGSSSCCTRVHVLCVAGRHPWTTEITVHPVHTRQGLFARARTCVPGLL